MPRYAPACYHVSDTAFCQSHFRRRLVNKHVHLGGIDIPNSTEKIIGLAVCWNSKDAYFLSLALSPEQSSDVGEEDLESRSREPLVHNSVTRTMLLNGLQDVLEGCDASSVCVMFNVKEQIKKLSAACNLSIVQGSFADPKVADWLLRPDEKEKNYYRLLSNYLPNEVNSKKESIGFLVTNPESPRVKACAKAVLSSILMDHLKLMLEAEIYGKHSHRSKCHQ